MSDLITDLRNLAWRPESEQEVHDEAAAQGRRPARPGEQFRLVIHRDPSGHTRPAKRQPKGAQKQKMVKDPGMSINDWMGANPMVRAQLTDDLITAVSEAVDAQQCPTFLNGTPYIRETYYFRERRGRDHRNFGKQLIDALELDTREPDPEKPRKAGIIQNDSDSHVLLDRPSIITGDPNPRIEILLIDTRTMNAAEVADLFRASALEQCERLLGAAKGA